MKKLNFIISVILICLFGLNLSSQECLLDESQKLFAVNTEIRVLEISNESEREFNNTTKSFEISESNYLEKNPGYSFLNEDEIPFAYVGFYKEYHAMWDNYSDEFISKMPEKMTVGCQTNKEYIHAMVGSYFNKIKKGPETLEKTKCLTIAFLNDALKNDCASISEKHYLRSIGFDIISTKGLQVRDNKKN